MSKAFSFRTFRSCYRGEESQDARAAMMRKRTDSLPADRGASSILPNTQNKTSLLEDRARSRVDQSGPDDARPRRSKKPRNRGKGKSENGGATALEQHASDLPPASQAELQRSEVQRAKDPTDLGGVKDARQFDIWSPKPVLVKTVCASSAKYSDLSDLQAGLQHHVHGRAKSPSGIGGGEQESVSDISSSRPFLVAEETLSGEASAVSFDELFELEAERRIREIKGSKRPADTGGSKQETAVDITSLKLCLVPERTLSTETGSTVSDEIPELPELQAAIKEHDEGAKGAAESGDAQKSASCDATSDDGLASWFEWNGWSEWSLDNLCGCWLRNGDLRVCWTIDAGGRAFFKGKYAGREFDFVEEKVGGKVVGIFAPAHRDVGEELSLHHSTPDRLIWTYHGAISASWDRASPVQAAQVHALNTKSSADNKRSRKKSGAYQQNADFNAGNYGSSQQANFGGYWEDMYALRDPDMDLMKCALWQGGGFDVEPCGQYQDTPSQSW